MTLGIFLSLGDSFRNMSKSGQDVKFKRFYLQEFAKSFDKVLVYSYENEKIQGLPQNVEIVINKYRLHRYIYGLLLPFLNTSRILKCDVFRAYHLSGTIPAVITKLVFGKNYVFNYAFDYSQFAKLENKKIQAFFFVLIKYLAVSLSVKIFAASKKILKELPPHKVIYLPNGADTSFFKPQKLKKERNLVVLSVGRLEKQKNLGNLIWAMKSINAKLVIVGSGSLESELRSLAANNKIALTILKKVANTRMPEIYNSANVFVMPSIAEGSPKALLEAMACQVPVIGTRTEGINEIIVDNLNGLLVSSSSRDLAIAITKILKTPILANKLARNARKTVELKFNLADLIFTEVKTLKNYNLGK